MLIVDRVIMVCVVCKEVVAQSTSRECRRVISCFIMYWCYKLDRWKKSIEERYYLLSGDLIYLPS